VGAVKSVADISRRLVFCDSQRGDRPSEMCVKNVLLGVEISRNGGVTSHRRGLTDSSKRSHDLMGVGRGREEGEQRKGKGEEGGGC
jgi:hypothetical protein